MSDIHCIDDGVRKLDKMLDAFSNSGVPIVELVMELYNEAKRGVEVTSKESEDFVFKLEDLLCSLMDALNVDDLQTLRDWLVDAQLEAEADRFAS
jgi:hypothetical protein